MEEKIYQLLLGKLGKTSLSEQTIRGKAARIAKKLSKEEEITDDVISDAAYDLKDIEGQLNHDVATAVEEAKKNFAKPNANTVPKTTPTPAPAPQTTDPDIIKRLEAMEKFQKEYKADQAKRESERKRNELTESVKKMLETQGCSVGLVRENAIYKIGIDTEKSAEDNAKAIKDSYDSILSESIKNGVIPQTSVPLSVKTLTDAEHAKQAKEIGEKLKQFI